MLALPRHPEQMQRCRNTVSNSPGTNFLMSVSFKTIWSNAVVLIHSRTNIMLLNCGEGEWGRSSAFFLSAMWFVEGKCYFWFFVVAFFCMWCIFLANNKTCFRRNLLKKMHLSYSRKKKKLAEILCSAN